MCAETTTTNSPATPFASAAPTARVGRTRMAAVCGHLAVLTDAVLSAMERWRQRRALMALDDHLLRDIGVSRADVEHEVGKSIWRD